MIIGKKNFLKFNLEIISQYFYFYFQSTFHSTFSLLLNKRENTNLIWLPEIKANFNFQSF